MNWDYHFNNKRNLFYTICVYLIVTVTFHAISQILANSMAISYYFVALFSYKLNKIMADGITAKLQWN